ncbi:MAG: hypothetical protein RQ723_01260 [Desulfuromonadales bacterium]|nr:hypothetical protein [Desulfuromonadales bacterium]
MPAAIIVSNLIVCSFHPWLCQEQDPDLVRRHRERKAENRIEGGGESSPSLRRLPGHGDDRDKGGRVEQNEGHQEHDGDQRHKAQNATGTIDDSGDNQ